MARLKAYADEHPTAGSETDWLRGSGWDQAAFGRMPTSEDLETLFPGKYIMLARVDAHCIWISSAVIDLLPDPLPHIPGGEVIGKGVFCDNAMDMVYEKWPKPSKQKTTEMVEKAMGELNKVGIVGVHDAGVVPETLSLYKDMAKTKEWTLRVYAMLECRVRNTFCGHEVERFARKDGMLSLRSVKLFAGKITHHIWSALTKHRRGSGILGKRSPRAVHRSPRHSRLTPHQRQHDQLLDSRVGKSWVSSQHPRHRRQSQSIRD